MTAAAERLAADHGRVDRRVLDIGSPQEDLGPALEDALARRSSQAPAGRVPAAERAGTIAP